MLANLTQPHPQGQHLVLGGEKDFWSRRDEAFVCRRSRPSKSRTWPLPEVAVPQPPDRVGRLAYCLGEA